MSEQVRVRGTLRVTIEVTHEFTVDHAHLDDWMREDGGLGWDGSGDGVLEFLNASPDILEEVGWPAADPRKHDVIETMLVHVDVLGRESHNSGTEADRG